MTIAFSDCASALHQSVTIVPKTVHAALALPSELLAQARTGPTLAQRLTGDTIHVFQR